MDSIKLDMAKDKLIRALALFQDAKDFHLALIENSHYFSSRELGKLFNLSLKKVHKTRLQYESIRNLLIFWNRLIDRKNKIGGYL